MTKSVTRIQDKDSSKRVSVVRSTEDPTKYGVVILNPDGSKIRGPEGPQGPAATIEVGETTTGNPGTNASVTNSGTSSAAVFDFTIPRGDKGDPGSAATIAVGSTTTGDAGTSASVTNSGTSSAAVFDFTIPKGSKGDPGSAATISVGTTTTGNEGTNASVTNSGTSSAAVFNFTIPRGNTGATGNGIASVTSSKSGKITTVTITETDGDSSSFQISDGQDGQGSGDVLGPNSSTDGDIVLFDGNTGKLIKDGSKSLSDLQDKLTAGDYIDISSGSGTTQTATGSNTISTPGATSLTSVTLDGKCEQSGTPTPSSPVNIVCNNGIIKIDGGGNIYADGTAETITDGTNTATAEMLLKVGDYKDTQEILSGTITRNCKIYVFNGTETWYTWSTLGYFCDFTNAGAKTGAGYVLCTISTNWNFTSANRLLCSISQATFPTLEDWTDYLKGQYQAGTPVIIVYPIATPTTESVTSQTLDAVDSYTLTAETSNPSGTIIYTLPSGTVISSTLESKTAASGGTDVSLVTTGEKYTWNNKLDASKISDTAYGAGWDGDTTHAPTKNAVYDKISAMDTTISGKADSSSLGTAAAKDTGTSSGNVPVLDSNGKLNSTVLPGVALTDTFTVTNKSDLTSLSSAAQGDIGIVTSESKTYVLSTSPYSTLSNWKELLSPTDAVTSVNSKTGAVTLDADDIGDSSTTNRFIISSSTAPSNPNNGDLWYNTTNNTISGYDNGWMLATKIYGAGTGIDIDLSDTIYNDGVLTVNGNKGDVTLNDVKVSSTAPANPTEGMVWYDTTNDVIKTYDGSNWNEVKGGIESTNNTYDNVIYLSQSDYDNLGTYDANTLYSTPDGEAGTFVDDTAYGASWDGVTDKAPSKNAVYDKIETINSFSPSNAGSTDQVLTKTAGGYEWANASGGGKFVDIFMVGGGGGGGGGWCVASCNGTGGSGGGGGGYVECRRLPVTSTSTTVYVGYGGAGGAGKTSSDCGGKAGGNGGNSYFGDIRAYGGGGGGGGCQACNCCVELSGGNLGGGVFCANVKQQGGHQGGGATVLWSCNSSNYDTYIDGFRAGGGGAGGDGHPGGMISGLSGGNGGKGIYSNFNGTRSCYAGGGGGSIGKYCNGFCFFRRGCGEGGGGDGARGEYVGCNATCPGGGGGGGYGGQYCGFSGGNGATGILYVRYPSDGSYGITSATGGTKTSVTVDGVTYCLHTFTGGSGTFTIVS